MNRAKDIAKQIIADPGSDIVGELANDLLHELFVSGQFDILKEFLSSSDTELVRRGIWVTSELGVKGSVLLDYVMPLLEHSDFKVRFFAIDSVLSSAGEDNGPAVAAVVKLLEDPSEAVRWKTLDFLWRVSDRRLRAAHEYYGKVDPESIHADGLRWLTAKGTHEFVDPAELMHGDQKIQRLYGVALAARMGDEGKEALQWASQLEDHDITDFAQCAIDEDK